MSPSTESLEERLKDLLERNIPPYSPSVGTQIEDLRRRIEERKQDERLITHLGYPWPTIAPYIREVSTLDRTHIPGLRRLQGIQKKAA